MVMRFRGGAGFGVFAALPLQRLALCALAPGCWRACHGKCDASGRPAAAAASTDASSPRITHS